MGTAADRRPLTEARATASLQVWLLGGFRVAVEGRELPAAAWRRARPAQILKLLALAPGQRLHREQVTAALWPELGPEAATNNLHRNLSEARRVLQLGLRAGQPAAFLRLDREHLTLAPEGGAWVDVAVFEVAARDGRDASSCKAALARYGGELLPEDRFAEWTQARRASLHETYLRLLRRLASLGAEAGDGATAAAALERLLASEPTDEAAHAELMRLYARSGDRDRALRQYRRLAEALRHELDAEPEEATRRLFEEILAGRLVATATAGQADHVGRTAPTAHSRPATNLPIALSSFVDRVDETAELRRLLRTTRLLTLTGTGGVGKTRLAQRVAEGLVDDYADGVWLVELGPLADPELVPAVVASAVGVLEQPGRELTETLVQVLGSRQMLLLLDNCEHLAEACATLADRLLRTCPELRILVTSRQPLRLAGEQVWRLPSLPVPVLVGGGPGHATETTAARDIDSVRLFADRAQTALSTFALSEQNVVAITQICRRLDGIPLAIELAAARVSALAPEQIAARVDDRFRLLTGGPVTALPRHRTLQALVDWSHDLLDPAEQALLRRLAVFAGGWTLEAAEAVCADDELSASAGRSADAPTSTPDLPRVEVLDTLARLVEKSLVLVEPGTTSVRYRLLETIRAYAAERLAESGETALLRDRHATHFLQIGDPYAEIMFGPELALTLDWMEENLDNLRAATAWAAESPNGQTAEYGLGAVTPVMVFSTVRGHVAEGSTWIGRLLARATEPSEVRAWAVISASYLPFLQGKLAESRRIAEEGLELARQLAFDHGVTAAHLGLGAMAVASGELDRAASLLQRAWAMALEHNYPYRMPYILYWQGELARAHSDLDRADAYVAASIEQARELGSDLFLHLGLTRAAQIALGRGHREQAAGHLRAGLAIARDLRHTWGIAWALDGLARVASMAGQAERAARLAGAADALLERVGATRWENDAETHRQSVATARAVLGDEAYAAAHGAGRELSLDEAIAEGLAGESA